jgi:P pilus assembly protein, porin PapC
LGGVANANYSFNDDKNSGTSHSVNVSGSALEQNNLSWNVQAGYNNQQQTTSSNVGVNYQNSVSRITGGYGVTNISQTLNYGISGGVVVHADGVTFSQSLGDTVVLVKAKDAGNIGVSNQTGLSTDSRGFAVVPFATPYHKNDVSLDTSDMPANVELVDTTKTVIPTRGAVVRAEYSADIGARVLLIITRSDKEFAPFGSIVTAEKSQDGTKTSIVGDGGQVYLTGVAQQGVLQVSWGKSPDEHCQVQYRLPTRIPTSGIYQLHSQCS